MEAQLPVESSKANCALHSNEFMTAVALRGFCPFADAHAVQRFARRATTATTSDLSDLTSGQMLFTAVNGTTQHTPCTGTHAPRPHTRQARDL